MVYHWYSLFSYFSLLRIVLSLQGFQSSYYPISKIMCELYLQCSPSHKHFHPWNVEWLLSLLVIWALVSSLTNFKLAWKIGALSAFVMVKHCSVLALLCIDYQHFLLQCNAAFLFRCLVVRQIEFILNLIPVLLFVQYFILRPIYGVLGLSRI